MVTPRPTAPPPPGGAANPFPAVEAAGAGVVVAAPAKLNLFLEVLGKRADGYHSLETLMVAIDLYDTLEIQPRAGGAIALECDPPGLSTGPDNLVYRAADRLRARANRPELGATVRLTKRIPMQAGLAGGSSDAAAALVGLNRVWNLGLSKADLAAVAAEVGSDVAFFLDLPAAWCTGRGEVVAPESAGGAFHLVLVCPPVGLATADVFRRLHIPPTPIDGSAARAAFRAGDAGALGRCLFNRLQAPAFALAPAVEAGYLRLAGLDPAGCLMSGSGSAVFALARGAADAARIAAAYRAADPDSRVLTVRTLHVAPA